jgi:3-hydroxyacyl-[acyl-carrier-protein] dehydratase
MLNNSFYQVIDTQVIEGGITVTVGFNAQHAIFEGHFPGQPVVPGVCILQIIKEQLTAQTKQSILLKEAAQVKYLNMITPATVPAATITILYQSQEPQQIAVTATVIAEATTYCKARLVFSIV